MPQLGLPNLTWLAFRRTFATWAENAGMRYHARLPHGTCEVATTQNIYVQVVASGVRQTISRIGPDLFTIVHEYFTAGSSGGA